jgi:hypothetical protein
MKETYEVVRAMTTTAMQIGSALEDHQVTYLEVMGMFLAIGIWQQAIQGIERVPQELKDATDEDMAVIRSEALKVARQYGVSMDMRKTQDLSDGVADMVFGLVRVLRATGAL